MKICTLHTPLIRGLGARLEQSEQDARGKTQARVELRDNGDRRGPSPGFEVGDMLIGNPGGISQVSARELFAGASMGQGFGKLHPLSPLQGVVCAGARWLCWCAYLNDFFR